MNLSEGGPKVQRGPTVEGERHVLTCGRPLTLEGGPKVNSGPKVSNRMPWQMLRSIMKHVVEYEEN